MLGIIVIVMMLFSSLHLFCGDFVWGNPIRQLMDALSSYGRPDETTQERPYRKVNGWPAYERIFKIDEIGVGICRLQLLI